MLTQLYKETPALLLLTKKKIQLQRAFISYPPQQAEAKTRTTENLIKPHSGDRPSLLRTSVSNDGKQDFFERQLRPAFYDELSLGGGKAPNSSLSMADLTLRYQDSKVSLSSLSILTIESISGIKAICYSSLQLAFRVVDGFCS